MEHDHHMHHNANKTVEYAKFILLILAILGFALLLSYVGNEDFVLQSTMQYFMAGFFLVFALFKLANISEFVEAYMSYDIIAKHSKAYAYMYPFLELALAGAYFWYEFPLITNIATIIILGISSIGVLQVFFSNKHLRCACLGNVIKLEVSTVTVIEDLGMIAMAVGMLTFM